MAIAQQALPLTGVARVRRAKGYRGSNVEYVINTAQHLHELQLHDARLRRVCERLA